MHGLAAQLMESESAVLPTNGSGQVRKHQTLHMLWSCCVAWQGNRKKRLHGEEHMAAIEEFVEAVVDKWPGGRLSVFYS